MHKPNYQAYYAKYAKYNSNKSEKVTQRAGDTTKIDENGEVVHFMVPSSLSNG
jgi:hypothetical protein